MGKYTWGDDILIHWFSQELKELRPQDNITS